MAFKRSLISSQSPLKWPLMHGGIPIPRHATATGCLTPINGRISAHLAAPRPFYNSTEQRPLQATDALHADEHAIKKAALQARPHTIQFQSNLLSNQPLRKSKQNPSKCTFRFFGHFTTSRRNSLKHRGFRPLTAHSTLHVSFYRPYWVIHAIPKSIYFNHWLYDCDNQQRKREPTMPRHKGSADFSGGRGGDVKSIVWPV